MQTRGFLRPYMSNSVPFYIFHRKILVRNISKEGFAWIYCSHGPLYVFTDGFTSTLCTRIGESKISSFFHSKPHISKNDRPKSCLLKTSCLLDSVQVHMANQYDTSCAPTNLRVFERKGDVQSKASYRVLDIARKGARNSTGLDIVQFERPPSFACSSATFSPSSFIFPAFDALNLTQNEGIESTDKNYKLCFAACADIRNLIETVNNLPSNYQGRFDVLINNSDPIIINRDLVILYALLNPEPSIDEAAELAVHLMYSAALSAPSAAYLQRCLDDVYGSQYDGHTGDFSFRTCLSTRGEGKICSLQTVAGVRSPLEMFMSTYNLAVALKNRWKVLAAPENVDTWDRFLSRLRPNHRMAFKRFRETGVLAPFAVDTSRFTHPNRLMFSSQGTWLGKGKIAMIESADIFGCLFFYLKDQFRRFAYQVKNLNVNFVLTQFDPQILARGISTGVIPIFEGACFDRVDTKDMMDDVGIEACLADWGPLLNRENRFASLLMHSRAWHSERPYALARCNPRAALMLFMHKCFKIPTLNSKLKDVFAQGLRSPALLRLIESLDAFYDHDDIFQEFLDAGNTGPIAAAFDLGLRPHHKVHPKRFGVPLDACAHQMPDVSKSQFYDLASLCEVDFSARFLEFACSRRTRATEDCSPVFRVFFAFNKL
ncbi:hypothetical protein LENED_006279 [Lentinula edodes]|uniref:DUF4470 domain-containing protein n=1 Tax=Lentinula edodes TaxID=5353 RepID=A0A1Q3EB70_LENED|nr:hypothetical protein LENED_006279 [Lentinula edodes]